MSPQRRIRPLLALLPALLAGSASAFSVGRGPAAAAAVAPNRGLAGSAFDDAFAQGEKAAATTSELSPAATGGGSSSNSDDDDDDEYEYVEYEDLQMSDLSGSEWKIGTVWNDNDQSIEETWVRLVFDEDGGGEGFGSKPSCVAVWGDGAKGTWSLDVASQFFTISKETFGGWLGKKIWAGPAEDFYYLQGTVRGWNPLSPASVRGVWQMKRLGCDKDEMGTAPWFEVEEEEGEEEAAPAPQLKQEEEEEEEEEESKEVVEAKEEEKSVEEEEEEAIEEEEEKKGEDSKA